MAENLRSDRQSIIIQLKKPHFLLAVILVIAVIIGGGGVAYGLTNLFVQLSALTMLAMSKATCARSWRKLPNALKLLIGATLLIPILTLLPLPFEIWRSLPGRELASETLISLDQVGWRSLSLDPGRSWVALVGLVTPLAVILVGGSLSRRQLVSLAWLIVAIGVLIFFLSIPQVLSDGRVGLLYPESPMPGVLFATFANRNSTGLFFTCCLALALFLPRMRAESWFAGLRVAAITLFGLAIILTGSRSSIALAAIILLAGISFHIPLLQILSDRRLRLGALALLLLIGIGAVTTLPGSRAEQAFDRFAQIEDARAYIWEDAKYSAERYWPLGAGPGTFDEVAQIDESLENLTIRKAGRAHNDYLEVAVEAGLPGLALIASWLFFILWLSIKARKSPDRWIAWSGSAILLSIAAQSLVDYPLRNQAMLAIATFALILLLRFSEPREQTQ